MTELDLAAIEARVEATPKGPWFVEYFGDEGYPQRVENHAAILIADTHEGGEGPRPIPEFIAHARTDVPALLAEVNRLRATLSRVKELALMGGQDPISIRQWIIAEVVEPKEPK